jgi:hypothetical protein
MGESLVQWLANSTYDLKVVGSNVVSSNILDEYGFKSIPGFIPAPNSPNFIFEYTCYLLSNSVDNY